MKLWNGWINMNRNNIKNYLFTLLATLSTVALTNEAILVPDNILDFRSGKLIQAQIHIKDGLIKSIAKKIDSKADIEVINLNLGLLGKRSSRIYICNF